MKISVIGYSGAGKSTMSKKLALLYNITLLYLDTVQFSENWVVRDNDKKLKIVQEFMKNTSWVIDGTYSSDPFLQKRRLDEADMIIFFNISRVKCLYYALKRHKQYKGKCRESIAEGCYERMNWEFLWWLIYEGRTRKRRNKFKRIKCEYSNKIIEIKSHKQADELYNKLCKKIPSKVHNL